jgi:hypothetical protein
MPDRASLDLGQSESGLRAKYEVRKTATGEPVEACFVLRPDRDPAARVALLAYAMATDNDALKSDLHRWAQTIYDATTGERDEALRRQVYESSLAAATDAVVQARREYEDADFKLTFTREAFSRADGKEAPDA